MEEGTEQALRNRGTEQQFGERGLLLCPPVGSRPITVDDFNPLERCLVRIPRRQGSEVPEGQSSRCDT